MYEHEKSDRLILPVSPPNKAGTPVAEAGEGSGLGKENAASKTHSGRRAGSSAPSALDRVRQWRLGALDARIQARSPVR